MRASATVVSPVRRAVSAVLVVLVASMGLIFVPLERQSAHAGETPQAVWDLQGDFSGNASTTGDETTLRGVVTSGTGRVMLRQPLMAIAAGTEHTVGLRADGTCVAVGANDFGECDVSGWRDIIAISTGDDHTVGLKADGTCVGAGWTSWGQLDVSTWEGIVAIASGDDHTVGLKADGTVVAAGYNGEGQCDVSGWHDIVAVAAGYHTTIGLMADGTVVGTGWNFYGQLDLSAWEDIVAVAAGWGHTVGLKADGTVLAIGYDAQGQCGVGGPAWTDIVAVAAGYEHTVGLKADGSVVAVGYNWWHQCDVSALADVVSIAAGANHTVALGEDGVTLAVGDNRNGQCSFYEWQDLVSVAAGEDHTIAAVSDGTCVTVGDNDYGQLHVTAWESVAQVAAGEDFSVGLKGDGTCVAAGDNYYGQCNVTPAAGWTGITAIATGDDHVIGLKDNGTVLAIGDNSRGQLAVGGWTGIRAIAGGMYHTVGVTDSGTCIAVGANEDGQCEVTGPEWNDIIAVAAGDWHTVGLRSDGTCVGAGEDDLGQLDVSPADGWTDIIAIAAGDEHTVGLKSDGTCVAAGYNDWGQCDVSAWTDIVAVSAGYGFTVGLREDGTCVAVGGSDCNQCEVTGWNDPVRPRLAGTIGGSADAVGLRVDGGTSGASWGSIETVTSTLRRGHAVKFAVRASDDGVTWSEPLGSDGEPVDWTDGTGTYLGQAFGDAEARTQLTAVPSSRYLDIVVRLESGGQGTPLLEMITLTYEPNRAPIAADDPGAMSAVDNITAADGAAADAFGHEVDISGDTLVIGSHLDDDAGSASGSAYVYVRSGAEWVAQAKLTASDAAERDWFGHSVAVDGDTVVVGAPMADSPAVDAGAVYVFTRTGDSWSQAAKLTGDGAGDSRFGWAVDLSGDTLVSGSGSDANWQGAAYVFTGSGASWSRQAKLLAADGAYGDEMGNTIAVDGDVVALGARGDDEGSYNTGSAFVFKRTDGSWAQAAKLVPADPLYEGYFGDSVAVSGETVMVGCFKANAVYSYAESAAWGQVEKITAADAGGTDGFGCAVALDGDRALVGAYLDEGEVTFAGSAYVFERTGGTWQEVRRLIADDGVTGDNFGWAVALDGECGAVGAYLDDTAGGVDVGSAYAYGEGSYEVLEDSVLSVSAPGVLANDADPEGATLVAGVDTEPAHGALVLAADGGFSYTPASDYNGADSFTYTVSDGVGGIDTATVSLSVTPVQDAPVAADDTYTTFADTALTVAAPGVLANDTDVDSPSISAVLWGDPISGAVISLSADGSFSYTPRSGFVGTDYFTYRAFDGTLYSEPVTVWITVTAPNTAPVATADAYSTPANTKLTVAAPGVLGNDDDAESDPLSAVKVAGPSHGTLALNTNGSFTYTPDAGYVGGDSFTYKAKDAELDSNTVTVTLTVTPKTITIDNAEAGVTFARYFTGLGGSFSGGSYTYAYSRAPFVGTRLEARFFGRAVKWIGPRQDFYGKAKVYIDGVYKTTVDCYSATPVASTAIYTSPTLSEAWHTVTVEMIDGKNAASTNYVVVIDHFEVTGAAPKKAATRYSEKAGTFIGNWIPVSGNPTYTDSTYAYSYWLGHRYTLRFTGTKVAWLGPKVYNYGRAGVYLDGVYKGTVSQYAAPAVTAFRAKVWESATLASGTHTLEIRPLATKDAASAGKVIVLDAFDVTP